MIKLFKRFQLFYYSFFLVSIITLRSFFTRKRFSHQNGIAAKGKFVVNEDIEFPHFPTFRPGKEFDVVVRHASLAYFDDAALVTRGASIKFIDEDGEAVMDIQMNSGMLPPFWSVRSFFKLTLAAGKGAQEHYGRLMKKFPKVRDAFISDIKRVPSSFAEIYYRNRPSVILSASNGVDYYIKFQLAPEGYPENKFQPTDSEQANIWDQVRPDGFEGSVDYLKEEFRNRLEKGTIKYHFRFQLYKVSEAQSDEVVNPVNTWDEERHPLIEMGTVTLDECLSAEQSTLQRFDLSNQPREISFIKAKSVDDYNSLNYIRLMGEVAQKARFLGYKLFGMPKQKIHKPFVHEREKLSLGAKLKKGFKTLALLGLLFVAARFVYLFYFPNLPKSVQVYDIRHLNDATWTEEYKQKYYHTDQGSRLMPYKWYINLEDLGSSKKMFNDPDNLSRFRLIPDPNPIHNEYRLPVGFAITPPDLKDNYEYVGISCATCHTGQLNYKGMGLRIDGGSGMIDFDKFLADMIASLALTISPLRPAKFDRFARKVLQKEPTKAEKAKLKKEITKYLESLGKGLLEQQLQTFKQGGKNTPTGFGRIDALGQGGNTLYRNFSYKNMRPLNAPVGIPSIWYTHQYDWVQLNSSIRQPMSRNIIEALAVNALVVVPGQNSPDYSGKEDLYLSNIDMQKMYELEEAVSILEAPKWPEDILGKLDKPLIDQGKALYTEFCAGCHAKKYEKPDSSYYPVAFKFKKRYYHLRTFGVDEIGTDPTDAVNFADRMVIPGNSEEVKQLWFNGKDSVGGASIIAPVINGVMARKYKEMGITNPDSIARMNGYRAPLWRAEKFYPARPLSGIWTSAPYLHNNAVPNLYELLSPVEERSPVFWTGDLEYDPVKVGYLSEKFQGGLR